MSAGMLWMGTLFKKLPTVWYPPRNCYSEDMEKAASVLNLKIDNESYDIKKFIREVKAGTYLGHSLYFHAWNHNEMDAFAEMIESVLLLDKQWNKV